MPYDRKPKSKFGRGQNMGRGTSVVVGEAVLEPTAMGPQARSKPMGPPSPGSLRVDVGEARVEQPMDTSLRAAERRRYGKKARTAYTR